MRLVLMAAALALAACNSGGNPVAGAKPSDVGQDEARAAYEGLSQAFASGDSMRIMDHYAPGAVILDAGHVKPTTDRQLQTKWTAQFATMNPADFVTSDLQIQPLGPDAFVATGLSGFTVDVGDTRQLLHVRFNQVFKKQPDGRWLVVNEHISMPPPEPGL